MSTEENKALAYRVVEEIFSQGDLNRVDELLAPDMVVHDPDKELRGREQVKQGIVRLHAAFPDLRYTIEDLIAEGDKVAMRYRGWGTHQGEFRGVLPTGKEMTYTGILILRFAEGKVVEHWAVSDVLGIFQQLGVISPLG
jgi:predicted ester cyclase